MNLSRIEIVAICVVIAAAAKLMLHRGDLDTGHDENWTLPTEYGDVKVTQNADGSETIIKGPLGFQMDVRDVSHDVQLPEDVPQLPNVSIDGSVTTPNEICVMLETVEPFAKVAVFYEKGLEANNWDVVMNYKDESSATFMAIKNDRVLSILAAECEDSTSVTVSCRKDANAAQAFRDR